MAFIKFLKSTLEFDHSYMLDLVSGLDNNLKDLVGNDFAIEKAGTDLDRYAATQKRRFSYSRLFYAM